MTNILDVKGLRNFHKDSQRFEIERVNCIPLDVQ